MIGTPAGFKSEWWPASVRNAGRLRVGIPDRLQSESALAYTGLTGHAEALEEALKGQKPQWIEFDPSLASDVDLAPEIVERNTRWKVNVRRSLERDE